MRPQLSKEGEGRWVPLALLFDPKRRHSKLATRSHPIKRHPCFPPNSTEGNGHLCPPCHPHWHGVFVSLYLNPGQDHEPRPRDAVRSLEHPWQKSAVAFLCCRVKYPSAHTAGDNCPGGRHRALGYIYTSHDLVIEARLPSIPWRCWQSPSLWARGTKWLLLTWLTIFKDISALPGNTVQASLSFIGNCRSKITNKVKVLSKRKETLIDTDNSVAMTREGGQWGR